MSRAGVKPTPAGAAPAARVLADYVAGLRYEDCPPATLDLARQCLADAVGCAAFGSRFPWSAITLDLVKATGSGGPCRLPGIPDTGLHPPQAALALGAFSHAFELDSLRKPGAGVHPGATVALPALAMAQATGASGRDLLTAIVAGCEVLFRIGNATLHSAEKLGFHAPGITGPFGSAAACASLLRLDPERIAAAFGVCGSLGGGLLAFAKAGSGGMVKRLHLGRAAEAGVVAVELARRGYEGPLSVLEGRYGVLDAYCAESDPALLTKGLGTAFEIERLCIKKYACHVTSQAAVELTREMMAAHGFSGPDIAGIEVAASTKVASHHADAAPADLMLAQYSLPFNTALAAFVDPIDPRAYDEDAVRDPRIRDLARRVTVTASGDAQGWGVRMTIRLTGGRAVEGSRDVFMGCPERPFTTDELRMKFDRLAGGIVPAGLFDVLMSMDEVPRVADLVLA